MLLNLLTSSFEAPLDSLLENLLGTAEAGATSLSESSSSDESAMAESR